MRLHSTLFRRFADVVAAIFTLPASRTWKRCLLVYAAFVLFALPLGLASGFLRPGLPSLPPARLAMLPVYIMLRPALLEELVFRALLLPRNASRVSKRRLILTSAAALGVFVASHPLNAWLFRPAAWRLFTSPVFLITAALLGAACTAVYLISKSLWPPVLLHWSAVLIWIALLGGQGLVGIRS
jgi:predicted Abi (CAAX) family protease